MLETEKRLDLAPQLVVPVARRIQIPLAVDGVGLVERLVDDSLDVLPAIFSHGSAS